MLSSTRGGRVLEPLATLGSVMARRVPKILCADLVHNVVSLAAIDEIVLIGYPNRLTDKLRAEIVQERLNLGGVLRMVGDKALVPGRVGLSTCCHFGNLLQAALLYVPHRCSSSIDGKSADTPSIGPPINRLGEDIGMGIPNADMPQLFRAADAASLEGQARYLAWTRARLFLIVAAAACGIGSFRVGSGQVDLLSLMALVLFIAAVLFEGMLWRQHPERDWYDGRALAESVKTLAWKFAVAGGPFSLGKDPKEAERSFAERLNELKEPYRDLNLSAIPGEFITPWMRDLRNAPFSERQATYIADRAQDQQTWYTRKADANRRAARKWRFLLIVLELAGAVAALSEALTRSGLSFSPLLAAAVGASVAWLGAKQHDQLARAYSTAVSDLGAAITKLRLAEDGEEWANEMNDAEDAVSREHTLWLASRSQR